MWNWILVPALATAFYLPGVAPNNFEKGQDVPLLVNALTAKDSLIPYDFYHPEFNFCKPTEAISQRESLGSILFGDRLFTSKFQLRALEKEMCLSLCTTQNTAENNAFIMERIFEEYQFNWIIDGLPAAQTYVDQSTSERFYSPGVPLGKKVGDTYYLYNHYSIHVHYYRKDERYVRVVGVVVIPHSLSEESQKDGCKGSSSPEFVLQKDGQSIHYTYNIIWDEDDKPWGTRWDNYLHVYDPKIHWFSIVNSIVIILILASMVGMILMRTLHKDISRYNQMDEEEEGIQDDFGWKLVHADVFRAPRHRMALSILLGNGCQIICMLGATLAFAVLGFLSPSSRGSLGTMALLFYTFFSAIAGYVSAVMYKTYRGEEKKKNVMLTATVFPGTIFGILLLLNFILISHESSAAVPFGTLFALIAMWFLISIPLCVLGSYLGYRKDGFEFPTKTNQIPRQIPNQPLYLRTFASAAIGGILPFGAIFIELFFIMSSMWSNMIYYMFGFLFFVFIILVVTCCLVSILLTYFSLCAENYKWVWKSFFASAFAGIYIFSYSIVFYVRKLDMKDSASAFLYFGWSLVLSLLFAVFAGTIGYFGSFYFVRKIYSSIKVD